MSWRRVFSEKPTVAQLLIQFLVFKQNTPVHYYSHLSLPHTISPNFTGPLMFCSHLYSSLHNIATLAHVFSVLQRPCWHTKMRDKKS